MDAGAEKQNYPKDRDHNCERPGAAQKQGIQQDVYNHRSEQGEYQEQASIQNQEQTPCNLNGANNKEDLVRLEQDGEELACQP